MLTSICWGLKQLKYINQTQPGMGQSANNHGMTSQESLIVTHPDTPCLNNMFYLHTMLLNFRDQLKSSVFN